MNLNQLIEVFPTEPDCIAYLEKVRWNNRPFCPYCRSTNATCLSNEMRHHCNTCNTSFSVTVNTVFHHSHIPLQKWFWAIWLILNSHKKISARQLASSLKISKNSAWSLDKKIHNAMLDPEQRNFLQSILIGLEELALI